jgi:hypothetical protein
MTYHETNTPSLSEMPEHKSDRHGVTGAADVRTTVGRYQSDGTSGLALLGVQTSMDGGGLVPEARPVTRYHGLRTSADDLCPEAEAEEPAKVVVPLESASSEST